MVHQVTLTISDRIMQRARRIAQRQSRKMEDVLVDSIVIDDRDEAIDWTEPNPELEREKQAYLKMHAQLKRTLKGCHVAIFGGELVDHDVEFERLVERVRASYPRQPVWLTTVSDEPIGTIRMRSPRLMPE